MPMTATTDLRTALEKERGDLALALAEGDAEAALQLARVEDQLAALTRDAERAALADQARLRKVHRQAEQEQAEIITQLVAILTDLDHECDRLRGAVEATPRNSVPFDLLRRFYWASRYRHGLGHDLAVLTRNRMLDRAWTVADDLDGWRLNRMLGALSASQPTRERPWLELVERLRELTQNPPPAA